jgi:hypothetical protein
MANNRLRIRESPPADIASARGLFYCRVFSQLSTFNSQLSNPMSGQPKALDDAKQATVCSLVAAGISLRQAAYFVDCDPKSIRRQAARNDDFRRQLEKAKSEASIQPLQTLRQAAKDDWRAALSWMERIDPDRFTRPDASIITKREANQFAVDLVAAIEKAVSDPQVRRTLFELLTPAIPGAMRRRWSGTAMRRAVEQMNVELDHAQQRERCQRNDRRWKLFFQIRDHLPVELRGMLLENRDLLDPEEFFAKQPERAADKPRNNATNNASVDPNKASLVPPPGPYSDNMASPPSANQKPHNDLPTSGEALSRE